MPFPQFDDGDVEIRFNGTDEPYILHSWVLALHSAWFKTSLSKRWKNSRFLKMQYLAEAPRADIDKGTEENSRSDTRRVFELRFEVDSSVGTLMREPADQTEFVEHSINWEEESLSSGSGTSEFSEILCERRTNSMATHQDMLRTFYHVPPELPMKWDDEVRKDLERLWDIADFYACRPVLDVYVDNYLRQHRAEVLLDCKTRPLPLLRFGMNLQCPWVCKEACAYIIALDKRAYESMVPDLKAMEIAGLINGKRTKLVGHLRNVDLSLFDLQASSGRKFAQVAINLFRQWYVQERGQGCGSRMHEGYGRLYRLIATGKPLRGLLPCHVNDHCPGFSERMTPEEFRTFRQRSRKLLRERCL